MIIPVRCFTCGKVLADKWNYFAEQSKKMELESSIKAHEMTIADLKIENSNKLEAYFDNNHKGKILNDLGLFKMCCRRHMLGHVDLIDII